MASAIDEILTSATQNADNNPVTAPEKLFDAIGLMRGKYAPVGRAAVSFAAVSFVIWAVRPGFMFYEDGSPKPMGGPEGTSVPWWMLPAAAALVGGVFI
jgi:hypothetical protein